MGSGLEAASVLLAAAAPTHDAVRGMTFQPGDAFGKAYELPAGFAAMRTADLPGDEWPKVSVVHDAHLIHDVSRDGWHAAGMLTPITEVDKHATRLYNEHLFSQHFADPPPPKRRGKGKGKGKRRAHRM